jgi:hypothetical protein
VPPFVRAGSFDAIDLASDALFDAHMHIMVACVVASPGSIRLSDMMRTLVARFAEQHGCAEKLLKFFSVFLLRANEHPEARFIIQLFVEKAREFAFSEAYYGMLFTVLQNPRFEVLRPQLFPALAEGVRSACNAVTKCCLAIYCSAQFTMHECPLAVSQKPHR